MESTICSAYPQSELADVVGGKRSVRVNNPVERECPGDMDVERARVDQAVKLVGRGWLRAPL